MYESQPVFVQADTESVSRPTGLSPVRAGKPPQGGPTGLAALVAAVLGQRRGFRPTPAPMDGILSPVGASGAGASMASAPELLPSESFHTAAPRTVSYVGMDKGYEVFGDKSFVDVVAEIRRRVAFKFWGRPEALQDAVSVATLSLLEYWIPRFADEKGDRNFQYAVRYGVHRAGDHLLNEADYSERHISLSADSDDTLALEETTVDPSPTPEDIVCSDAVVEDVRQLVDELDWNICFAEGSIREESAQTGVHPQTIAYRRRRARNCMKAAYLACL